MNSLLVMKNTETITSLEIAEITNKDHKNIIRDIKDEISKLGTDRGQLIFEPSEYLNAQNKKQPMFNVTLDGVLQLGARYDAVIRFNLIQKVNELQNKIKAPTNLKEALLLALEQQEKIEVLELKVSEDKPKVLFADSVSASKTTILIRELAVILNQNGVDTGEKRLYKWLRDNGYLISDKKRSDYNTPTQKSMNLKLFDFKETTITHSDGYIEIKKTTKVTGKGQQYFIKKFLN